MHKLGELRAEVAALRGDVREGRALASDSEPKPDALPPAPAVADVPARKPESSGGGDGVLVRLARQLEQAKGLSRRLRRLSVAALSARSSGVVRGRHCWRSA